MSKTFISLQDVADLKQHCNTQTKTNIANKVGYDYKSSGLSDKCMHLAEGIFRLLLRDAEIKVRESIANNLKDTQELPRDIVDTILQDADSVALPFIQSYSSFNDEDLIKIVNVGNPKRSKAVASRANLSRPVSSHIVEKCSDDVLETLVTNESANLGDGDLEQIITKYPDNENLKKGIVYRTDLPFPVIEKIIDKLSDILKRHLLMSQNMPLDFTTNLVNEIKEKLTLKLSADYSEDEKLKEFVHQLFTANRLTYSLVTRAICSGDLKFFEYAISYMSETPINNVRKTLFNPQADFEVRNLLRKALLPKSVFPAVLNALKVINDIRFDCCRTNAKLFGRKVIERVLSLNSTTDELSNEDVNYLISQIN